VRSLKRLALITFLVLGGSWLFWNVVLQPSQLYVKRGEPISALVVEPKNSIPSQIIAELCGLSKDVPTYSGAWNLYVARLKTCPAFDSASGYCKNGIGYIDYSLRKPLFFIGGFENVACDSQGVGFPLVPIFLPLDLPILFPSKAIEGRFPSVMPEEAVLASKLAESVQAKLSFQVKLVDLRFSAHPSPYRREIILTLKNGPFLRLPVQGYDEVIDRIHDFLQTNQKASSLIDARFEHAFLIQERLP